MPFCTLCSKYVDNKTWIGHLRSSEHKSRNVTSVISDGVELLSTAFKSRITSYKITSEKLEQNNCIDTFLNSIEDKIRYCLDKALKKHTCLKVNFELFASFILFKDDELDLKSFCTKNIPIFSNFSNQSFFTNVKNILRTKISEFQDRNSGFGFLNCSHLELNINKYQPLRGSTYIDLPKIIKNKKACINIKNSDDYCFAHSVVAALHPTDSHPDRVSSYPSFREVLNVDNISFPMALTDIPMFEQRNPNIAFIVYGLNKNKHIIGPLFKSENISSNRKTIHLLYLENNSTTHYCLIKDLSRLLRKQLTRHHGKLFFCETCLVFFNTSDQVENHLCDGIVTVLPEKGTIIKFKNYDRKQNVPFVIYADFETMLEPVKDLKTDSLHTKTLQRHVPIAFAYQIVCGENSVYNKFVSYRGIDCVEKFVSCIYEDTQNIYAILSQNVPMEFSEADSIQFCKETRCHICQNFLFGDKVRDHSHITGQYRGAAHNICNLRFKIPKFIPIFFHNLSGYDCHLFIKTLAEAPGSIKIIPKTKENYISFTKFILSPDGGLIQLRFVDSFKFLGASLDKLAKTLQKHDFHYLKESFPNESQLNLLTRKGVYPYEYVNNLKRYEEKSLPSSQYFYNSLNDEQVTKEDYSHAQNVWKQFGINNLGEYTDLYLKTDVLLLTDIFEKFRATCKLHYQVDAAFYLTAPSLSFDAMLFKTGVELELIDDYSIVNMIQNGIRGGVCMVSHRHATANNNYMLEIDPFLPESFLIYIDCNNLYGYSMCQTLPHSDFKFLRETEVNNFDAASILCIADDADYGFILEVDITYPKKLHFHHNDLPFCPEKDIPPGGKQAKLIPNLNDKYHYVIHYVHLKVCLKHGLMLKKIHRIITFRQSAYLKQYIDLNTRLRQQSCSSFEQDFFKLLNNSIFGKTLENNEKKVNVKLVNQWSDYNNKTKTKTCAENLIAKPNFHSVSVFNENLVAIQLKPDRIVLDKPLYIGFAVLELSKSHMYDFHYSIMKPHYDERLRLCYTDTDSFIYHIETEDFYGDLKRSFMNFFDTSNFCVDNGYDLPLINKKVPGLFKDEMGGKIITEFVGLRSKLYCIKNTDTVIKKAKGVKASVVRNFDISDYRSTLLSNKIMRKKNILFKSLKHQIFTQSVNKIVMSSNDDKRLVSQDKVSTRAWGHISFLGI